MRALDEPAPQAAKTTVRATAATMLDAFIAHFLPRTFPVAPSSAATVTWRHARRALTARAREMTARNIGAVRRPVNVFCWLGWYVPTSVYGPTVASAP